MTNEPIVAQSINRHDPIGLLEMGCPQNEYDIEIKAISDQLDGTNTGDIESIFDVVSSVFADYFGRNYATAIEDKLWLIAQDIFEAMTTV